MNTQKEETSAGESSRNPAISVHDILARLEGVRQTSPGQWVAKCPAHKDRSPSLSVRDAGDGRKLLHCFAGCATEHVVEAIGLRLADLMPERALTVTHLKPVSLSPASALALLGHELNVAVMLVDGIAANYRDGVTPNHAAAQRLAECAARIAKVRSLASEVGTPAEILEIRRGGAA